MKDILKSLHHDFILSFFAYVNKPNKKTTLTTEPNITSFVSYTLDIALLLVGLNDGDKEIEGPVDGDKDIEGPVDGDKEADGKWLKEGLLDGELLNVGNSLTEGLLEGT